MKYKLQLRIGEICDERNISISKLSDQANISHNTAKSLYYGIMSRIDIPVIEKVANSLGLPPTALLRDIEVDEENQQPALLAA